MGKQHKVRDLRLSSEMEWVNEAIKSGSLDESGSISSKCYDLIVAMRQNDELMHTRPTYAAVRKFAASKGISNNMSQTTIKQAVGILFTNEQNKALYNVRSVNGLNYAIRSRLVPIISNERGLNEESQYLAWKIEMQMTICPLLMVWTQVDVLTQGNHDARNVLKAIPHRLHNLSSINTLVMDAIIVILSNADSTKQDIQARSLQQISESKHGRLMSYASIVDASKAAKYVFDVFVDGAGESLEEIYRKTGAATLFLIKPLNQLMHINESNDEFVADALEAILKGHIKGNDEIKRNLVMFS